MSHYRIAFVDGVSDTDSAITGVHLVRQGAWGASCRSFAFVLFHLLWFE